MWADAWGNGFRTAEQSSKLIDDLRGAHFNSLIVQMRRRGDTLYNSKLEPRIPELSGKYDPLKDLLAKAHDTSDGKQRLDVHAWLVTYHIWDKVAAPKQANHPYNLHPDWLMKDHKGQTRLEGQYTFDPGHPDVQRHTFDVCMEMITNYPIDGLHFDYVRYGSIQHGYHDVTVARFNRLYKRTGIPLPNNPQWLQFRRDQVTALVRKVYLSAIAVRPEVKISASTIAWSPGISTREEWVTRGRPYKDVLQDWRSWMEEGILDINVPMTYFRQHVPTQAKDYEKWTAFMADNRFNRHAVVGPGLYLNSVSNAIHQMRYSRNVTKAGNSTDGVSGYVYRNTNKDNVSTSDFLRALVEPSAYDSITLPIFAEKATIPEMPWKTTPTKGHFKGFITGTSATNYLDGATITVTGPVTRKLTSDATGFFGAVDLPPGKYTLKTAFQGYKGETEKLTVKAGEVANANISLSNSN